MEEKKLEVLEKIFAIARNLAGLSDVDTLLKRIGATAEELIGAEASSVMLLDDDRENLYFKLATGTRGGVVQKMRIPVGKGIAGLVAQQKQSLLVPEAQKDARFSGDFDKASGFTTRSILAVPLLIGDDLIGVMEVLNKKEGNFTEQDRDILENLAALAAVAINNARQSEDNRNFFSNILEILVEAIDEQSGYGNGHSLRVAQMSTAIAKELGLDNRQYRAIYYGALLHDIGFIASPEGLMSSVVVSTKDVDRERVHPLVGSEMIRPINILREAVPVVRHHHEYYDGSGYPDGLSGENIPLGARIVAVAEAADEMRKNGLNIDRISQMLNLGREVRFDPKIIEIILPILSSLKD